MKTGLLADLIPYFTSGSQKAREALLAALFLLSSSVLTNDL